jgi:hypothetical protein
MLDNASSLEQQRGQHPPDQAMVVIDPTDDLFLRSYTWARW